MRLENNFHGDRSSRLFVLRGGDAAMFGAGKILAERSEGAGPRSHRQTHRPVIQGLPAGGDGTLRTSSDWSWRAISAAVSGSTAKTAAIVGASGELQLCRVLAAVVTWIFEQAFNGCAAYAAAMYGIPVNELRDSHDPADDLRAGHEHTDRFVGQASLGQASAEISTSAKANLRLVESSTATLEAEFVAPARVPRVASPGWVASTITKLRSRIRQRRQRRLAAELHCFDDRSLRDVGISRCDIEYLVRHGDRRE